MKLYLIDDCPKKRSHLGALITLLGEQKWEDGFAGDSHLAHLDGSSLLRAIIDPDGFCLIDVDLPFGDSEYMDNAHRPAIDVLKAELCTHSLWNQVESKWRELQGMSFFRGESNRCLASWLVACRITFGLPYLVISTQRDDLVGDFNRVVNDIGLPDSLFPASQVRAGITSPALEKCAERICKVLEDPYFLVRKRWNSERASIDTLETYFKDSRHDLCGWTQADWNVCCNQINASVSDYLTSWGLALPNSNAFPHAWQLICAKARCHNHFHRSMALGVFGPKDLPDTLMSGAMLHSGSPHPIIRGPLRCGLCILLSDGFNGGEIIEALKTLKQEGWNFSAATSGSHFHEEFIFDLILIGTTGWNKDQINAAIADLKMSAEAYRTKNARLDKGAKVHSALDRLRGSGVSVNFKSNALHKAVEMHLMFTEKRFNDKI